MVQCPVQFLALLPLAPGDGPGGGRNKTLRVTSISGVLLSGQCCRRWQTTEREGGEQPRPRASAAVATEADSTLKPVTKLEVLFRFIVVSALAKIWTVTCLLLWASKFNETLHQMY